MAKGDTKPNQKELQKQFELGARAWKRNGGQGAYVPYNIMFQMLNRGGKKGNEPKKEDPELPPTDGGTTPSTGGGTATSTSGKPKSNNWPDIVAFNFPEGARKQYKDGGLVRGGGAATKGRGRGKMV